MKRDAKKDQTMEPEVNVKEIQTEAASWNTKKKLSLSKKILRIVMIMFVIFAIAAVVYFMFLKKSNDEDSTYTADITVGTNQELLVGQITSMNGNEIDFDIVEETTFEMGQTDSEGEERPSGNFSRGDKQTGVNQSDNNISTTDSTSTTADEATSDSEQSGEVTSQELPEGTTMPEGEMPEGMTMTEGEMPEAITVYQSTGEAKSLQIPVGTEVVTKLGNITTFSRLAVGDVVNLLIEKTDNGETIVKIWIVR